MKVGQPLSFVPRRTNWPSADPELATAIDPCILGSQTDAGFLVTLTPRR